MHDSLAFEADGLPAVFVASSAFVEAAEVQGKALGFEPVAVYVAHPIQDRTDEELQDLADGAVEAVVGGIVG